MKTLHETVLASTSALREYKETEHGIRVPTTCVFPSYVSLFVYVEKSPDGFVVHDAGETLATVLAHGQKKGTAKEIIRAECSVHHVTFENETLLLRVNDAEWLETAIVSLASTAALASCISLRNRNWWEAFEPANGIFRVIERGLANGSISKKFPYVGKSGTQYSFDLAVHEEGRLTLIDTVSANPNSVNSKYVAMADVPSDLGIRKIVAHNDDLSVEHLRLLQSVAMVSNHSGVIDLVEGSLPAR